MIAQTQNTGRQTACNDHGRDLLLHVATVHGMEGSHHAHTPYGAIQTHRTALNHDDGGDTVKINLVLVKFAIVTA